MTIRQKVSKYRAAEQPHLYHGNTNHAIWPLNLRSQAETSENVLTPTSIQLHMAVESSIYF